MSGSNLSTAETMVARPMVPSLGQVQREAVSGSAECTPVPETEPEPHADDRLRRVIAALSGNMDGEPSGEPSKDMDGGGRSDDGVRERMARAGLRFGHLDGRR